MDESKPADDRAALDLLIRGFQISRMIRLAADLGIADAVPEHGHADVAVLAKSCAVLPRQLLRLLRALGAFRIFRVGVDGTVGHTPRSLLLRASAPDSFYHAARFWTARGSWHAWEELDAALVGRVPHEAAWNTGRFQYLREHADEGRLFDAFMARFPDGRHEAIAAAYDFSNATRIVDVGGGNGETLRRILARHSKPRGVVFDRDDVVAAIPDSARLDGRIDVAGGSFFDHVPAGGDLYLIIRVLHDWSDEDCIRILRRCREAMQSSARLLIGELILEPDPERGRPTDYLLDMQMMAMFGEARERTEAEFAELFDATGLARVRVTPTRSPVSLIEVVPD